MKKIKMIIFGLGMMLTVFVGIAYMLIIPDKTSDYPQDLSVEDYLKNSYKNRDIIVKELEKINKPTLKETFSIYEKQADKIVFYPTALNTMDDAARKYIKKHPLAYLVKWRLVIFMHKNYLNTYKAPDEYFEAYQKMENNDEDRSSIDPPPYRYKDGSVVYFSFDIMSVEYAQQ